MGGRRRIPQRTIVAAYNKWEMGMSKAEICRTLGISRPTLYKWLSAYGVKTSKQEKLMGYVADIPPPLPFSNLPSEARKALEDFGYFRRRYFGMTSTYWQEDAAYKIVELLETPEKEFVVVNCPPGSGKTELFAHQIPAWVTVRNRNIRGLMGSHTYRNAEKLTRRLKNTLERRNPIKADDDHIKRGYAFDAQATIVGDFGRFRPENQELWRAEEFIIMQFDDTPITDKEPTWGAFGYEQTHIGMRYNFIIWDDLWDPHKLKTIEGKDKLKTWWNTVAERRLEPGGLLLLQGQRMGADDIYRYALDMNWEDGKPKYHHIVYPAHFEDKCDGESHDKAYPDGCLLDPIRLPWKELAAIKRNTFEQFAVLYQQEDMDPASVLIDPAWIKGGIDNEGAIRVGCYDYHRDRLQIPHELKPPFISVAAVDPSAAKMWAFTWIIYHPESEQRFVMDLDTRTMTADQLLDWHNDSQTHSGIMEDWQQRSIHLKLPIKYWIVESNVAQRYLLAYEHVRRWSTKHRLNLIPHQTTHLKLDPELGLESLRPIFKYGHIRLPNKGTGRLASLLLTHQATHYVVGGSKIQDDILMTVWFIEFHLPRITMSNMAPITMPRPKSLLTGVK